MKNKFIYKSYTREAIEKAAFRIEKMTPTVYDLLISGTQQIRRRDTQKHILTDINEVLEYFDEDTEKCLEIRLYTSPKSNIYVSEIYCTKNWTVADQSNFENFSDDDNKLGGLDDDPISTSVRKALQEHKRNEEFQNLKEKYEELQKKHKESTIKGVHLGQVASAILAGFLEKNGLPVNALMGLVNGDSSSEQQETEDFEQNSISNEQQAMLSLVESDPNFPNLLKLLKQDENAYKIIISFASDYVKKQQSKNEQS